MSDQYSVTSVGITPAEDRAHRMRMYFIAMSIRVLCIVSLFWVRGWWILLVGAGAVLLPYIAVMLANAVNHNTDGDRPDAPTPLALESEDMPDNVATNASAPPSTTGDTIVVDAPAYRRSDEPGSTESPA